jgi:hypothetical protein
MELEAKPRSMTPTGPVYSLIKWCWRGIYYTVIKQRANICIKCRLAEFLLFIKKPYCKVPLCLPLFFLFLFLLPSFSVWPALSTQSAKCTLWSYHLKYCFQDDSSVVVSLLSPISQNFLNVNCSIIFLVSLLIQTLSLFLQILRPR